MYRSHWYYTKCAWWRNCWICQCPCPTNDRGSLVRLSESCTSLALTLLHQEGDTNTKPGRHDYAQSAQADIVTVAATSVSRNLNAKRKILCAFASLRDKRLYPSPRPPLIRPSPPKTPTRPETQTASPPTPSPQSNPGSGLRNSRPCLSAGRPNSAPGMTPAAGSVNDYANTL